MKKILLAIGLIFFIGCSSKEVVIKKQNPSYELQHQNYKEEIKELDKI